MADEPGGARGVPEAARAWLAGKAERMNPPEPPERPVATDGGTPDQLEPDDAEAVDESADGPDDRPLTTMPDVEPADAEQLAGAGVETVGALALADQERLVRDTDIDPGRVETLVGRARELVESG